jgi:hypothetical protein
MVELELPALDAGNPLGFLAALGTLAIAERQWPDRDVTLGWNHSVQSHPCLRGVERVDELAEAVLEDRESWKRSPALEYPPDAPWTDVKVTPQQLRDWLQACLSHRPQDGGRALTLATALVAELSLAGKAEAKPTDLHFTAGQQKFLTMARTLRDGIDHDRIIEAVQGPWRYDSTLPSFKWDVSDDRIYALSATNPADDKKRTVPGAEWLALHGLSLLPTVGQPGRTLTPGCRGQWKDGEFTWPIWTNRITADEVRSLMTLPDLAADEIPPSIRARSVHRVLRSRITRSDQGGYGSFRPPRILLDTTN